MLRRALLFTLCGLLPSGLAGAQESTSRLRGDSWNDAGARSRGRQFRIDRAPGLLVLWAVLVR